MRAPSLALAGRQVERRAIDQAFAHARDGQGQALFIEGLAGTGKSRLVEYALAEATRLGFLALAGGGTEEQECAPYGLVLDAFRRHLRRNPNQPPAWLEPRSPWTALVNFRPEAVVQGAEHAFHEICQALGRHGGPVLLALEDLHVADRSSLEIIERFLREVYEHRIFLIGTWRSEGVRGEAERAVWLHRVERHPRVRHVRLEGLSLADTRELVAAMMPSCSDHGFLARQLHRRTEDNPLFLEELLRGISRHGDGPDAALPVSFREAVRARLTGLTREDLRLLQLAAVIGEWFDIATLAYLGRKTETRVLEAIARLREHQLLRESADGSQFRFWHALTRDALYEQLLLPDRRALHRRIAQRWIAGPAGVNTHSDADIAFQLEKAGEKREAARHYEAAAERAASLHAFGEAFAHAERAFAFSPHERGLKALHASRFARLAGNIGAALEYCAKAHQLLDTDCTPLLRAEVVVHESDLHWLKGDGRRAAGLLNEVEEIRATTSDNTDAPVWAWFLARQGHRACLESRWADVFAPADDAIAMSRRLRLPLIEAHALISRSMAEASVDAVERGLATLHRGRALAERHGGVEDVCRSYVVEVDLRSRHADFATVCRTAVEGAEYARRSGAPVVLFPELAVMALEFLWKSGRWQAALDRVAETERLVDEQPSDLVRCHFRGVLAHIAIARHRFAEAEHLIGDALGLARKIYEAQWVLPVYVAAAERALTARQPGEALQRVIEALSRFPDCESAETMELRALGLQALCSPGNARIQEDNMSRDYLRAALPSGESRLARYHAKLAAGFTAMRGEEFVLAADEFGAAVELAEALECPAAEARAREWQANALLGQGAPASRQAALHQRDRAHCLLAGMPGRRAPGSSAFDLLSERESQVAHLVADGHANKEVGSRLAISDRTVAVHVSRIFEKLGVNSRHQLVALVAKHGRRS